jgi:hypothetical protein
MKIENDVKIILDEFAKEVGKTAYAKYHENTWCEFEDLKIFSPIEQIFYAAIKALLQYNYIDEDEPELIGDNIEVISGFGIYPQEPIGKYRVDFLINYGCPSRCSSNIKAPKRPQRNTEKYILSQVIVECDSQKFHERTEKERRYEKARDRYLQSNGYLVFHYTGAEIVRNSTKIAAEIISFVTGIDIENIQLDSNLED